MAVPWQSLTVLEVVVGARLYDTRFIQTSLVILNGDSAASLLGLRRWWRFGLVPVLHRLHLHDTFYIAVAH